MDRGVVLLVSGALAALHLLFILHAFLFIFLHVPFICMHFAFILQSFPHMFLAFSFHAPFICIHFLFMFLSFSFQCAFMSFYLPLICTHFPFILHSCPFISFLKLWKNGSMAWPGNRVQQMVFAKLSLRLSLDNPSIVPRKFATKRERERERESERERERERKRERERESERERERERMCTIVFAWFTPSLMDFRLSLLGEPYRFTVFHARLGQKTPAILKWSSTILTVADMN